MVGFERYLELFAKAITESARYAFGIQNSKSDIKSLTLKFLCSDYKIQVES